MSAADVSLYCRGIVTIYMTDQYMFTTSEKCNKRKMQQQQIGSILNLYMRVRMYAGR